MKIFWSMTMNGAGVEEKNRLKNSYTEKLEKIGIDLDNKTLFVGLTLLVLSENITNRGIIHSSPKEFMRSEIDDLKQEYIKYLSRKF